MNSIVLYTLPDCPWCEVLKKRLDHAKIQYKEISDKTIIKEKGFISVPHLVVNETEVYDYAEAIEWLNHSV